ncbi:MAG: hypothetical protein N4A33_02135 [Bacteriovoracaceae bacterium]|jgi:ribosomal protein RSM22 (predicted rRNA methylase)|nr:hypothetical protein [Bacteriovoracaceae bacterium]
MNYTDLLQYLIAPPPSSEKLVKDIKKVINNFTANREDINKYLKDESFVSAYTAFHFYSNYFKFDHIYKKILGLEELFESCDVVEIGAGPGSFSFSIETYCKNSFYAIEPAALMRKQASVIKDGLFKDSNVNFISGINSLPKKDKDRLIIFTNSFNEMSEDEAYDLIRKTMADHILFIEPGTKEVFKRLINFRAKLSIKKFNTIYPCSSNENCPLEDKDDWCHQYLKLSYDLDYQRVCQLVKVSKKWQAQSLFLFSIKKEPVSKAVNLRVFGETKFSKDWLICEDNQIKNVQNHKSDYDKSDYKTLDEVLAGDIIEYDTVKELKQEKLRIKLKN